MIRIWENNNSYEGVPATYRNAEREAEQVLEVSNSITFEAKPLQKLILFQWWWQNRYGQSGTRSLYNYSDRFGSYLQEQYRSTVRVNPRDNRGYGRF